MLVAIWQLKEKSQKLHVNPDKKGSGDKTP